MSDAEYIIWKCETVEQIEKEHPEWGKEQVEKYFSAVELILREKGFLD